VQSFSQEQREVERFRQVALDLKQKALKAERTISLFSSLFGFNFFAFYTYTFYIATIFYEQGFINIETNAPYVAGDLITILVA
jgi:ABC-type multidrug transport system fused ATPase/permease subunit